MVVVVRSDGAKHCRSVLVVVVVGVHEVGWFAVASCLLLAKPVVVALVAQRDTWVNVSPERNSRVSLPAA